MVLDIPTMATATVLDIHGMAMATVLDIHGMAAGAATAALADVDMDTAMDVANRSAFVIKNKFIYFNFFI
jgi:hypothetical protein